MNLPDIKTLIELLKTADLAEIEVKQGEDAVRIRRHAPQRTPAPVAPPVAPAEGGEAAAPPAITRPANESVIHAPMVGTFYLAPSPEAAPFVSVGQTINRGDTVCMIEAMKMFNQIEADTAGTVKAILVENGQPVEFDQPLVTIV